MPYKRHEVVGLASTLGSPMRLQQYKLLDHLSEPAHVVLANLLGLVFAANSGILRAPKLSTLFYLTIVQSRSCHHARGQAEYC